MKNIFLLAVLATLLLAPFASATVSEVTAEASSSSVTTGTSVTVTSTVTATGSETSSVQLISSPSGITVSDPASGSYSSVAVSTTPVTKTFTITAGSAGTYTYYAQAGSTQSTAKTIVFSDPSVLTISGDSSTVSKTSGQTFTLSISLANSQSSAITSSYSLNLPSGYYSVSSGDPQTSTGRSFAVGTTTLSWTISIASGAASGAITFQLGSNTNAFSKSVTIPSSSTTTTTTSASSTSGTSTANATTTETKTITNIAKNGKANVTITKSLELGVKTISIQVANAVNNVQITVAKTTQPAGSGDVVSAGKVYKYMEIKKSNINDSDISSATIKIQVERSWLAANNIDEDKVYLYRYNSAAKTWEKLATAKESSDAGSVYYNAETPGFSVFAIAGETKAASAQPEQLPQEQPAQPGQEQPPQEQAGQQPSGAQDNTLAYVLAAAILIAGAGLYFAQKKNLLRLPGRFGRA